MIPAPLKSALTAFDEAALSMLTNKGLVRRAQRDIEEGKVTLAGFDGKSASVIADGETVTIDERGPRTATCTCPALGVCRHRIAAVFVIQNSQTGDATPAVQSDDSIVIEAPSVVEIAPIDFKAEVAAISLEAAAKWAGKGAWRAALDLVDDGPVTVTQESNALLVKFGEDGPLVRYLAGQGLEGIVSKASAATRTAYHSAAFLALRRHFGLEEPAPPVATPSEAVVEKTDVSDREFLSTIANALVEAANVALNIAPISLEERLFMLSVSSRADALPRLSAMLRTLSKMVRSKRQRDFQFDPDACLSLITDCFAIVTALDRSTHETATEKLAHLQGRVRQDYVSVGDLPLTGCGADLWRTQSGARGITSYFYHPTNDLWYSASIARAPGQDAMFDPLQAYSNEGIFGGHSLSKLSTSQINLMNASAAQSGRLSAGQDVRATIAIQQSHPDISEWNTHFTAWGPLEERLRTRLIGGLSEERRGAEPVILSPRRLSSPRFDDLAQTLTWAIEDEDGAWLSLTLEHGRDRHSVFDALNKIALSNWSGSVVALASLEGHQFRLRPFALIGQKNLVSLGLDYIPEPTKLGFGQIAALLLKEARANLGRLPVEFVALPKSKTQQTLDACWHRLVEMAEIGISLSRQSTAPDMARHAQKLVDAGFERIGGLVGRLGDKETATPANYFQACYSVALARRHMVALPIVRPIA